MSTAVAEPKPQAKPGQLKSTDYKGKIHPDWCPGCGDFSVVAAMQMALADLNLPPYKVAIVSGIGCSSNLPGFMNTYGMHTLHGRSLPVATGLKLGNNDLTVIATGGDGDGFGIGGNHFVHSIRRNIDVTYVVMDNQIYGLTTGQLSPTARKGMITKTSPDGSIENPINPIPMAIACGATYVARGTSGNPKHLANLIKGGIQHKGFSFIDVFSPCVTYNKVNTKDFFAQRVKLLEDVGHNTSDKYAAMEKGYEWGETIYCGLFWKDDSMQSLNQQEPVLSEGGPLAFRKLGLSKEVGQALIKELM